MLCRCSHTSPLTGQHTPNTLMLLFSLIVQNIAMGQKLNFMRSAYAVHFSGTSENPLWFNVCTKFACCMCDKLENRTNWKKKKLLLTINFAQPRIKEKKTSNHIFFIISDSVVDGVLEWRLQRYTRVRSKLLINFFGRFLFFVRSFFLFIRSAL